MVLVDTSVWLHALYGKESYLKELDRLLAVGEVSGHELVYGELLIGDRGGRAKLLATYERFPQALMVPHREVAAFTRHKGLHGRGAGWTDIHLLASAIVGRIPLWTADTQLAVLARELGVAYERLE